MLPETVEYGDTAKFDGELVKIIGVQKNWWKTPALLSSVDILYSNGTKETIPHWNFKLFSTYIERSYG